MPYSSPSDRGRFIRQVPQPSRDINTYDRNTRFPRDPIVAATERTMAGLNAWWDLADDAERGAQALIAAAEQLCAEAAP